MRVGVKAAIVLICFGGAARAGPPPVHLDLPAGPLSAAVATIGAQAETNIGTSEPDLLAIQLPPLHVAGTSEEVITKLASMAGVGANCVAANTWELVRLPSRPLVRRVVTTELSAIVVEGAKRTQKLVDDPVDIVRIDGSELGQFGSLPDTRTISDLVPTLGATDWGDGHDKLFLRGVADSSFLGVSPALVGQYWGDQRLNYSAPDPNLRLYDVSSVEVMEGPQGTLYGAGGLGGLVRIEPNVPDLQSFGGAAWSGGTNVAHGASGADVGAIVNLPLARDHLALRLLGYSALEPGYIDDVGEHRHNVNRTRVRGGRAMLRWMIGNGWTIDVYGIGQSIDNRDASYSDAGMPPLTRSSATAQPSYDRFPECWRGRVRARCRCNASVHDGDCSPILWRAVRRVAAVQPPAVRAAGSVYALVSGNPSGVLVTTGELGSWFQWPAGD